jgi:hypothetical protein
MNTTATVAQNELFILWILTMEAVRSSETSVNYRITRPHIPDGVFAWIPSCTDVNLVPLC